LIPSLSSRGGDDRRIPHAAVASEVADVVSIRYGRSWMTVGALSALALVGSVSPAVAGQTLFGPVSRFAARPVVDGLSTWVFVSRQVRPAFDDLLAASPTFREQCRRIVAAGVKVMIEVGLPDDFPRGTDGISKLVRDEARRIRFARVRLSYGSSWPRLIPHELEHVLEQIDGLNLAEMAARQDGRAWRVGDAYETRRAQLAGELVSREFHGRTPVTTLVSH
jgi:hypothetical protein